MALDDGIGTEPFQDMHSDLLLATMDRLSDWVAVQTKKLQNVTKMHPHESVCLRSWSSVIKTALLLLSNCFLFCLSVVLDGERHRASVPCVPCHMANGKPVWQLTALINEEQPNHRLVIVPLLQCRLSRGAQ